MSAFETLRNGFQRVAPVGAAIALVTSPMSAHAEDAAVYPAAAVPAYDLRETPYCAPLRENAVGREMDASYSAYKFSQENVGKVGISIFPGQDLGDKSPEFLGTLLVNSFRKRGVEAECFVHHETGPKGTGLDFKINGHSWGVDRALNLSEVLDVDTIEKVVAEAKTAKMLLSSNDKPFDLSQN